MFPLNNSSKSQRICCPICQPIGSDNPSLSISVSTSGSKLYYCFKGCDFKSIKHALASNNHINNYTAHDNQPTRCNNSKNNKIAKEIWEASVPIFGTLAEKYLRRRGITCVLPSSLKYDPECYHSKSDQKLPAMIALVSNTNSFAIHRTYLNKDGTKYVANAPSKAMLGSVSGGHVKLGGIGSKIYVTEGIENALSIPSMQQFPKGQYWAALSVSGIQCLNLPTPPPSELIIAADNDDAGSKAANKLGTRACHLGWKVSCLEFENANDLNEKLFKENKYD